MASHVPGLVCYDDDGEFPGPAATDCLRAIGSLRNEPFFGEWQTYGPYEDPPRRTPLDWVHGSCLISIDVDDGSMTDTFALWTTMAAFAAVEEWCILKKRPGEKFGGYAPIGHGKTFYAIVQYNPDFVSSAASSGPFNPSNSTDKTVTSRSIDTG